MGEKKKNINMGKCGKGTGSIGQQHVKSHSLCLRCGKKSLHIQKKVCSSCAFPAPRIRKYNWSYKAIRRRTTGTGRMRHLRYLNKKRENFHIFFKNKLI